MNKGWISLSRKIQDCFIWEDKPFAKGQAWIDMLLLANHSEKKVLSKNEVVLVEKGSFLTSDLKLSERWGWGRKKTRLFLELLEDEQMIVTKRNSKGTIINIVNYSVYQTFDVCEGTSKEHQKNIEGTTENSHIVSKAENEEHPRNSKGTSENAVNTGDYNNFKTNEEHKRNIQGTSKEHPRDTNNNDNNDNNVYKEMKHKHGTYSHVLLKDSEKERLISELGETKFLKCIEKLDSYIQETGKVYKDHNLTIRRWVIKAVDEEFKKQQPQKQQSNNKFNNFNQRSYSSEDFKNMEAALLRRQG